MTTPNVSQLGDLEPVIDWPRCPACGSERWHHLGDFEHQPTGRTVDVAVLHEIPTATLMEPGNPKPVTHLPWHIEPGIERARLLPRECRECNHQWRQDTGTRDAVRTRPHAPGLDHQTPHIEELSATTPRWPGIHASDLATGNPSRQRPEGGTPR
ncbi:hypothetical protein GCM10017774_78310 [Lentzea cavernae]|uniref:Uncharacterized protein n=1 Tax=Lentzea cavernae TaxID=2020703 RepID=A0ABQ3MT32_9PSEU|nr:hypothetical protein GCM10017774_78310 [Lentzea cavernae]